MLKYIVPPENNLPVGESGYCLCAGKEAIYFTGGWMFDRLSITLGIKDDVLVLGDEKCSEKWNENEIDIYTIKAARSGLNIAKGITVYLWEKIVDGTLKLTMQCGRVIPEGKILIYKNDRIYCEAI